MGDPNNRQQAIPFPCEIRGRIFKQNCKNIALQNRTSRVPFPATGLRFSHRVLGGAILAETKQSKQASKQTKKQTKQKTKTNKQTNKLNNGTCPLPLTLRLKRLGKISQNWELDPSAPPAPPAAHVFFSGWARTEIRGPVRIPGEFC